MLLLAIKKMLLLISSLVSPSFRIPKKNGTYKDRPRILLDDFHCPRLIDFYLKKIKKVTAPAPKKMLLFICSPVSPSNCIPKKNVTLPQFKASIKMLPKNVTFL